MKTLFIFLTIMLAQGAFANVYQWTDEKGVVHFSDSPEDDGAIEIELTSVNVANPFPSIMKTSVQGLSTAQCQKAVRHIATLKADKINNPELKKHALSAKNIEQDYAKCITKMTPDDHKCIMLANNADQLSNCTTLSPTL